MVPTVTFASNNKMNIEFPNGLMLNEDCQFKLAGLEKEAHIVIESLENSKGNEKAKIFVDSKNRILNIGESGKYQLRVRVDNEINVYYINIDTRGAFYGTSKDILNYEMQTVKTNSEGMESFLKIEESPFNVEKYDNNNGKISKNISISDIELEVQSLDLEGSVEKLDVNKFMTETPIKSSAVKITAESVDCAIGKPYLINTEYPVRCTYTNFTTTNATNRPLKIMINSSVVYSTNVNANARSRYAITLQLTIPNANTYNVVLEVGEGDLLSRASKEFLFSESIGKNLEYYVLDTPDNTQPFNARDEVTFRNFLQNTGTVDTGIFNFDLYFNNGKLGTYQMRNIVPGEKVNLNFKLTNPVQGTYPVKFVMDPNHQLTQKDLTKEMMTMWNGNGADLIVKNNIALTPPPFYVDTDINFGTTIVNQGTKHATTNVIGSIYAKEETTGELKFITNYNVNQMNVDKEISFNYAKTLNKTGNWYIVNEIDINNCISESNENNNTTIIGITISKSPVVNTSAWYSQKDPNWDDTKLDILFMPNLSNSVGANTPMEWWRSSEDEIYENPNGGDALEMGHINKWGCFASSCAMLLANEGAQTLLPQKDFRNDAEYKFSPDPFTLIMANRDFPDIILNETLNIHEITNISGLSPTNMEISRAIAHFGYEVIKTPCTGKSNDEIYDILVELIDQNPKGVMVKLLRSEGMHALVFIRNPETSRSMISSSDSEIAKKFIKNNSVKLKPEIEAIDYEMDLKIQNTLVKSLNKKTTGKTIDNFIVCDSATPDEDEGSNVRYADTPWTATHHPNLTNIAAIYYFNEK